MSSTCIAAFVVFNHEESFRRCMTDYGTPPSLLARLLVGTPAPLKFRNEHNGATPRALRLRSGSKTSLWLPKRTGDSPPEYDLFSMMMPTVSGSSASIGSGC